MPGQQGQYTTADLAAAPQKQGQYSLADIAPTPAPPKGFTDHVKDAIGEWWNQVNPVEGIKGMAQAANHPIDTLNALGSAQGALLDKAEQAFKAGKPVEGVRHVLNYLVPIVGTQTDKAGDQMDAGNYGAGLGTTAGVATNIAAPELIKGMKLPGGVAAKSEQLASNLYQSAMKPATTLKAPAVADMVRTGIENKIPVSAAGVEKLNNLTADLNQKIGDVIALDPNRGINKYRVAGRLNDTFDTVSAQVNPERDIKAVSETGNEFLRNNPGMIPAERAQQLKTGTYQQLSGKYGELGNATIEAQKALARGLKEELAQAFPELDSLNAADSKLLNLQPVLERAVNRNSNHQLIGIGTPMVGTSMKAVTGSNPMAAAAATMKAIVDTPAVKSQLAFALSRAAKGKLSISAANARIAAYSNALGNSAEDANRSGQQSQQEP